MSPGCPERSAAANTPSNYLIQLSGNPALTTSRCSISSLPRDIPRVTLDAGSTTDGLARNRVVNDLLNPAVREIRYALAAAAEGLDEKQVDEQDAQRAYEAARQADDIERMNTLRLRY